jgi:hypothetical protein
MSTQSTKMIVVEAVREKRRREKIDGGAEGVHILGKALAI